MKKNIIIFLFCSPYVSFGQNLLFKKHDAKIAELRDSISLLYDAGNYKKYDLKVKNLRDSVDYYKFNLYKVEQELEGEKNNSLALKKKLDACKSIK